MEGLYVFSIVVFGSLLDVIVHVCNVPLVVLWYLFTLGTTPKTVNNPLSVLIGLCWPELCYTRQRSFQHVMPYVNELCEQAEHIAFDVLVNRFADAAIAFGVLTMFTVMFVGALFGRRRTNKP